MFEIEIYVKTIILKVVHCFQIKRHVYIITTEPILRSQNANGNKILGLNNF